MTQQYDVEGHEPLTFLQKVVYVAVWLIPLCAMVWFFLYCVSLLR